MRGNFDACLTLLWGSDPSCPDGKDRDLGLTLRTVAAWRGCLVSKVDNRELQRGEAGAILDVWFWRGIRADELPLGIDYMLFDHAVCVGPKQAVLDFRHLLGLRRFDGSGGMDGITLRAAETANPKRLIAGIASFARDKERGQAVAKRAIAMAENGSQLPEVMTVPEKTHDTPSAT